MCEKVLWWFLFSEAYQIQQSIRDIAANDATVHVFHVETKFSFVNIHKNATEILFSHHVFIHYGLLQLKHYFEEFFNRMCIVCKK